MAIKFDCPRCRNNLLVPSKKAGSYVNCPRCGGRFWVPKDAPADVSWSDAKSAPAAGAASGPPSPLPSAAATGWTLVPPAAPPVVHTPPPATFSEAAVAPPPSATPPAAPAAARLVRPPPRVARLISADAAQSVLKPSADGQLPDLQLQEGIGAGEADAPAKSLHPAVLFGVPALSVAISVVLAMASFGPSDSADSEQKAISRQYIEEHYFGGGNIDRGELQPYQIYLREAKRAHSNGDLKMEKARYRKVLDLLRADRGEGRRGLTGSRTDDEDLEKHIGAILSGE